MLSACQAGVGIAQIMQLGSKHIVDSGRLVELFSTGRASCFRSMPCIPPASIGRRKCAPSLISPSMHLQALMR
jgi:hypothetical protein